MTVSLRSGLKVADEVWIATVLLHRERPDRSDFSIEEIVERVQREDLHGSLRPASMFTWYSTVWPTGLQTLADTACFMKQRKAAAVFSARATQNTRTAGTPRACQRGTISPRLTAIC